MECPIFSPRIRRERIRERGKEMKSDKAFALVCCGLEDDTVRSRGSTIFLNWGLSGVTDH